MTVTYKPDSRWCLCVAKETNLQFSPSRKEKVVEEEQMEDEIKEEEKEVKE